MFTSSCQDGKGCLGVTYDFFTKSKVGVTASLVIETASLVLGILVIMHILPEVDFLPAAIMTGTGGFCFILTIVLASYRQWKESAKASASTNSILDQPSKNSDQPIDISKTSWKERLEQVRVKNKEAAILPAEVPAQECLNTLSYLAQKHAPANLFKSPIPYVEPSNAQMVALVKDYENKKDKELYSSFACSFLQNLPALNAFIRSKTQEVLFKEPTDEDRENFKLVNKQIRMILLFLMSQESGKSDYLKKYKSHVAHSFGNRSWNSVDFLQPTFYFEKLKSLNKEKSVDLSRFLFMFSVYRRHSLHHLFPTKIETRSKCSNIEIRTLLSATWFHGTRAITTLSDTDFILIPTGWLHQVGHTSFFGEMRQGCQKKGVNANSLSGTYLDQVGLAINSYATGFQFDIKSEIRNIEEFLAFEIDLKKYSFFQDFCYYSSNLPRIEAALKRWARWDQTAFKEKIPELQLKLKHLNDVIKQIKRKKPKEIFNWHDTYYSGRYQSMLHSISQIEAFLSAPLPQELTSEQKKNIEGNFPAVLGSLTLLSEPYSYTDETGEHLVRGTAQMGKDLQLLCVEKSNLEKAKEWINANLPESNIRIFSFEQLREAQKINQTISPYLADIFSLNKFNKLCATV